VKKPEIDEAMSANHGTLGAEVNLKGMWFGTKKGKVYIGVQKCKVTSWIMDPVTGESTIAFVVHKNLGAGTYDLEVENKIGRGTTSFTVD
jgi:hypothetical protein